MMAADLHSNLRDWKIGGSGSHRVGWSQGSQLSASDELAKDVLTLSTIIVRIISKSMQPRARDDDTRAWTPRMRSYLSSASFGILLPEISVLPNAATR